MKDKLAYVILLGGAALLLLGLIQLNLKSVNADELPIEPLELVSVCTINPDLTRGWRIQNLNAVAITVHWDIVGSDQSGSLVVAAAGQGDYPVIGIPEGTPDYTFFETLTQPGDNTLKISYGISFEDTVASTGVQCPEEADLEIQKSGPAVVGLGETFGYQLTITNNGPWPVDFYDDSEFGAAEFVFGAGVIVTDTLPAGVELVSILPSQGNCDAETVTCRLGGLGPHLTATVQITVEAIALGVWTNVATATNQLPPDNYPDNNRAEAVTEVLATSGAGQNSHAVYLPILY
jgi:hypothetical protein